jgi:hypothetical protein
MASIYPDTPAPLPEDVSTLWRITYYDPDRVHFHGEFKELTEDEVERLVARPGTASSSGMRERTTGVRWHTEFDHCDSDGRLLAFYQRT